jgi:hypothetical protein
MAKSRRGTTASRPARTPAARMIPGATQPQFMDPESRPLAVRKPAPIKVRATQMGYYDHVRRREGDVFVVESSQFSKKWMERVDAETPERVTTAKQALKEQHDEILGGRQSSRDDSVI